MFAQSSVKLARSAAGRKVVSLAVRHHNHAIWERPFKKGTIMFWTLGSVVIGVGAIWGSVCISQWKGGYWFKK